MSSNNGLTMEHSIGRSPQTREIQVRSGYEMFSPNLEKSLGIAA
jgi:hypothetical protein